MALCPLCSTPLLSCGDGVRVVSSVPPVARREVAYVVLPLFSRSKRGICLFDLLWLRAALQNLIRHVAQKNEKIKKGKQKKEKVQTDTDLQLCLSKPNWTWVAGCGRGLRKQECICRIHSKIGFQRLAGTRAQRAIIPVRM